MDEYLKKIFSELDALNANEYLQAFTGCNESEAFDCHFGLGLYLRNKYFWNKTAIYYMFLKEGIRHPDDMSDVVINEYYKHLQEK